MKNKQYEAELTEDGEAVYYSALSSLDELPSHGMRAIVVLNWVKYIVAQLTDQMVPKEESNLAPVFTMLCGEFAEMVLELPETFADQLDAPPCGVCPACIAARSDLSERPTEPAPKDETVN